MTSWAGRTATEIAAAVREKRVTPREVVAEHLARIELLDARVGAFRRLRAQEALAEADEVAGRADLADLPLAGVPIAVKDNLGVRGESTRRGSAATPDTPAAADHVTVARLRAAGAMVVGVTNVPELCIWGTTEGVSRHGPQPVGHHPHGGRFLGRQRGGRRRRDGADRAGQRRHGLAAHPRRQLRRRHHQAGPRGRPGGHRQRRLVRHVGERSAGDDGRGRPSDAVGPRGHASSYGRTRAAAARSPSPSAAPSPASPSAGRSRPPRARRPRCWTVPVTRCGPPTRRIRCRSA